MQNAKHTPGSWCVNVQNKDRPAVYTTHDDYLIADCVSGHRSKQEQLANANLISAAPDLLEALEAMLSAPIDVCENATGSAVKQADAAIQKAFAAIAKATQA